MPYSLSITQPIVTDSLARAHFKAYIAEDVSFYPSIQDYHKHSMNTVSYFSRNERKQPLEGFQHQRKP